MIKHRQTEFVKMIAGDWVVQCAVLWRVEWWELWLLTETVWHGYGLRGDSGDGIQSPTEVRVTVHRPESVSLFIVGKQKFFNVNAAAGIFALWSKSWGEQLLLFWYLSFSTVIIWIKHKHNSMTKGNNVKTNILSQNCALGFRRNMLDKARKGFKVDLRYSSVAGNLPCNRSMLFRWLVF